MQRRSSGSDDAADYSNPTPVNIHASPTTTLPLGLAQGFDASATGQATSAHAYSPSIASDSRRTSFDLRSQSARSRRSGNFSSWKHSTSTAQSNGFIEKAPLALSVEPSTTPVMAPKVDEDSDDVDKVPDAKGVLRRPRSRSPWAIGLLTFLVSLVGLGFLATMLNSTATRCLDPKGCIMSYMRPSYFHLSDFDTEHTRFGGKYSLYLYRELGVEDDQEIKVRCLHGFSRRANKRRQAIRCRQS